MSWSWDSTLIRLLSSVSFTRLYLRWVEFSLIDSSFTNDDVAVPTPSLLIRDAKLSIEANTGSP